MGKKPEKENNSNSSWARDLAKKPVSEIVKLLHQAFPDLTPNHVTAIGTTGIGVFLIYVARLEKEGKIDSKTSLKLSVSFLSLSATDAFDGGLAKLKKKLGEPHDSDKGALVDTLSDRLQEAFSAWLAMFRAAEHGDKLWLATATMSASTTSLSSISRAWAEGQGADVSEVGKGTEFLGTRAGKVLTSMVRLFPHIKIKGVSIQSIVDIIVISETLKVTLSRIKAGKKGLSPVVYDKNDDEAAKEKKRKDKIHKTENAKIRFKWLAGLAVVTGISTGVLLKLLLDKKDK